MNTPYQPEKWSELFEGENRSLRKTFDEAVAHQPEKQPWEERFNEIFVREDDGLLIIDKYDGDTLKIFIHSLLQEERDKCKNFLHVGKGQQCEHGGYNFGCGICLEALLEKERKAEREKLREVLTKEHYGKEHYGISDVINKEV